MRVGIALGSNLHERLPLLQAARSHLYLLHEDRGPFLCSRIYETEPLDCPPGSPFFLNAVIEIACTLPPLDLLAGLQRIEQALGRPREHAFHAPRTIDLDILYYDNLHFTLPELTLPHPRISERAFVLCPLADICPDRILPGWKKSIAARLSELPPESLPKPVASF
ncbi:MAG: 2-amino-4-hydroxy-6-hydroxymethyldihydropteridine diphosphokinase [Spartobacteria bacterium]